MKPNWLVPVFGRCATQYIPRNFLIGKDGKIKLASVGYSEADFQKLTHAIEQELKQP
jgi:hypothetical protein